MTEELSREKRTAIQVVDRLLKASGLPTPQEGWRFVLRDYDRSTSIEIVNGDMRAPAVLRYALAHTHCRVMPTTGIRPQEVKVHGDIFERLAGFVETDAQGNADYGSADMRLLLKAARDHQCASAPYAPVDKDSQGEEPAYGARWTLQAAFDNHAPPLSSIRAISAKDPQGDVYTHVYLTKCSTEQVQRLQCALRDIGFTVLPLPDDADYDIYMKGNVLSQLSQLSLNADGTRGFATDGMVRLRDNMKDVRGPQEKPGGTVEVSVLGKAVSMPEKNWENYVRKLVFEARRTQQR